MLTKATLVAIMYITGKGKQIKQTKRGTKNMKATREITNITTGINRIKFTVAVTEESGTHTVDLGLETIIELVNKGVEFEVNNDELAETISELELSQFVSEEEETMDGEVVYDIYEYKFYINEEIVKVDYDNFVKTYKRESTADNYVAKHNQANQKSFASHLEFMQ